MKKVDLFTTDDVTEQNDTYNLFVPKGFGKIGAVRAELVSEERSEAFVNVLCEIYPAISACLVSGKLWLLVADNSWVPDNRIARWKNKQKSDAVSTGTEPTRMFEEHVRKGRLRFFSAELLSDHDLPDLARNARQSDCSFLIYVPEHLDVSVLLKHGWESKFENSLDLLRLVCPEGFVLKPFGEFDDLETGWQILAGSDLVTRFVKFHSSIH